MDSLDIAIQNTALKSEEGAKRIASNMGLRYQTFINKCNPNDDTNKLGLREAMALMQLTDDIQILKVIAEEFGYQLEQKTVTPAQDLVSALLAADCERGDVSHAIKEAIGDGQITAREAANIQRQVHEAIDALSALLGIVTSLHKSS